MHGIVILFVFFISLSLAGILADIIAPKYPQFEEIIYTLLDKIM